MYRSLLRFRREAALLFIIAVILLSQQIWENSYFTRRSSNYVAFDGKVIDVTKVDSSSLKDVGLAKDGEKENLAPWIWKSMSDKKKLLVLGYEGSGSQMVASIFRANSRLQYYSEPTNAAYSTMYGTVDHWSALDIKYNTEGIPRVESELEKAYEVENMRRYYECDSKLVPDSLGGLLQFSKLTGSYQAGSEFHKCVFSQRQQRDCYTKIHRASYKMKCYPYFEHDDNQSPHAACLERLQTLEEKSWKIMYKDGRSGRQSVYDELNRELMAEAKGVTDRAFVTYFLCQYQYKVEHINNCIEALKRDCEGAKGIAIHDTRMQSKVLESLLPAIPDLRVVYVVDSPVEILKHRQQDMLLSHASKSSIVQEAAMFCKSMVDDLNRLKMLQRDFPNHITFVHLRQYVTAPVLTAHKLYRFLNLTMTNEVHHLVSSVTPLEKQRFADLTGSMLVNIVKHCDEAEQGVADLTTDVKLDN